MNSEQQFSNLIYEYFHRQFQFHSYKCGDRLPAIDMLCQKFGVADRTVKAALKRLQAEGFIYMHNGIYTTVTYQQTTEEARQHLLCFFRERLTVFPDLAKTADLVLSPFLMEGYKCLTREDIATLLSLTDQSYMDSLHRIYSIILQRTENPLVMNLFWEISFFMGIPFIKKNTDTVHVEIKNWDYIKKVLPTFHQRFVRNLLESSLLSCLAKQDCPKIGFKWRIYRGQPQICYDLALNILHSMYLGEYQGASFLPSYNKLSRRYGVSVSTVRRAISLLNCLGAVRPIGGKGVRIITAKNQGTNPDFTGPAIRRNLAIYFQAFELIIHTCEPVFCSALNALSPVQKSRLSNHLKEYLDSGLCELTLCHLLLFMAQNGTMDEIREIYGRLYCLFLLAYPLKFSQEDTAALDQAELEFTEALIRGINNDDAIQCGYIIREFVTRVFPKAERFLLNQGMTPEELRTSQTIQFS